ncbi:MAG: CDP-alcohol phosphatidyltransferase family protein, partial [Candidatus Eisenbacteria bacterium]|nr:CDP-alcohol phosphatidyltransferase family protein [Candidatus Eisenbacteria bacterium]
MTGGRNRARIRSGLIRWGISQATQFVWDRGKVGFRQNPEGMRAVIQTGLWLSLAALAVDIPLAALLSAGGVLALVLAHLFWISIVCWVVLLNIGFLTDLAGNPVARVGPANVLSFLRIGFLPTLAWLILERQWVAATAAYLLIALTDVADGIVARRRHEETRLGFVLDPIGDVCMQLAVFIPLYLRDRIGEVTMGAVLLRYGVLLGGCLGLYLLRGRIW